jgi:hypothetical protein
MEEERMCVRKSEGEAFFYTHVAAQSEKPGGVDGKVRGIMHAEDG